MNSKEIVIGKYYRFKTHPLMGYFKPLKVIPPKTGVNTHSYPIFKGEHTTDKSGSGCRMGFIRYFKAADLQEAQHEQ